MLSPSQLPKKHEIVNEHTILSLRFSMVSYECSITYMPFSAVILAIPGDNVPEMPIPVKFLKWNEATSKFLKQHKYRSCSVVNKKPKLTE